MDANGQRVWQLAGSAQWGRDGAAWDRERRVLRLASRGAVELPADDPLAAAEAIVARTPAARDVFGSVAELDAERGRIVVRTPGLAPVDLALELTPEQTVTDLAVDYDGVLWLVVDARLQAIDLFDRWDPVAFTADEFAAWRIAAHPGGGLWVLGAGGTALARVRGLPLSRHVVRAAAPGVFRPDRENPDPPRIAEVLSDLPRAVALACRPDGEPTVLSWEPDGTARVYVGVGSSAFAQSWRLESALRGCALAWLEDDRVAVRVPFLERALSYDLEPEHDVLRPRGDWLPLRDAAVAPFAHGLDRPPHYPRRDGTTAALHKLSLPRYASSAVAIGRPDGVAELFDSGQVGTTWHRLYVEASVPANCAVLIDLAATDDRDAAPEELTWFPHRIGVGGPPAEPEEPRAAWVDAESELAYAGRLLDCPPAPNRSGLFTVLIQRRGRRVRALRGRYLRVRVRLYGDRTSTPEVAAVRLWESRFSYRDRYLPELYREDVCGAAADEPAPSTGADFLDRALANFEGVLTGVEDRVAHAYRLSDPKSCPESALGWLASWVGADLDSALPVERQRRLLEQVATLHREHGTRRGLERLLDIATDGLVARGAIVVVEDFLLRRTFATVLGADLEDRHDPLLAGMARSGNSYVGDSLFLGEGTALADQHGSELLALFGAEGLDAGERDVVRAFFDELAHRATVLVHRDLDPTTAALVERLVERATPAHVATRVVATDEPLLVGIRSLVGVDTYLRDPQPIDEVRVELSRIGVRDRVRGRAALDPRVARGAGFLDPPPVAVADDVLTGVGMPVVLDASRSFAAPGRSIESYTWRWLA